MNHSRLAFLCFCLAITLCVATQSKAQSSQGILPFPKKTALGKSIRIPSTFHIVNQESAFTPVINAFMNDWNISEPKGAHLLTIRRDASLAEEEYRLDIGANVTVSVSTKTGLAWALQSLGQLIDTTTNYKKISDKPDVPFRCVTVDVARRYHSISTLKTLVRWCQLGKVRTMQLHLTDDQNWMLPTKVLPGVDQRNQHKLPAYTEAELKELQAFSNARGVAIVPEIEMPGHSSLLMASNPGEFKIQGSESSNCINFGSPTVRAKMKSLLTEVAALFPESPYIHIGGDEAWYPNAEKDPQFKAAIEKLGPNSNPSQVFVDFVAEMAEEVIRLKKIPVVWEGFGPDEYAKKRIPKQTVVIAWEGAYYPADKLVTDGFNVVNAGWDPYYVVNHFPYEAYTLVPLERLYKSNYKKFGIVTSPSVVNFPASDRLLGSMLCWWEGHEWNAHRVLPARIATFGCRLWNSAGEKDFQSFKSRLGGAGVKVSHQAFRYRYTVWGGMDVDETQIATDRAYIELSTTTPNQKIAWRTDGKIPQFADIKSQLSIPITKDMILTVQPFKGTLPDGETDFIPFHRVTKVNNLALNCPVSTSCEQDPNFAPNRMTDGIADLLSSHWLAYPNPQTATIDLRNVTEVTRIEVVAFWVTGAPTKYRLSVSTDNKNFKTVVDASDQKDPSTKEGYVHKFPVVEARYIRIEVLGSSLYPSTMTRINEIRVFGE